MMIPCRFHKTKLLNKKQPYEMAIFYEMTGDQQVAISVQRINEQEGFY